MQRVFTTDRWIHVSVLVLAGAWTVAAFAALARLGLAAPDDWPSRVLQFTSWLMPVAGVAVTWACLKMPHTITLTEGGGLYFQGSVGRSSRHASELIRVSRSRTGWFLRFESPRGHIIMMSAVHGLPVLVGALSKANPALEIRGI